MTEYEKGEIDYHTLFESFQGWNAYAKWGNSHNLKKKLIKRVFY